MLQFNKKIKVLFVLILSAQCLIFAQGFSFGENSFYPNPIQPFLGHTSDSSHASVFPKIITPNNDGINDQVFFFVDNITSIPVQGFVFDIRGSKIADIQTSDIFSIRQSVLTWNGKDQTGTVVHSGVYIYTIHIGEIRHSGSVVVAR